MKCNKILVFKLKLCLIKVNLITNAPFQFSNLFQNSLSNIQYKTTCKPVYYSYLKVYYNTQRVQLQKKYFAITQKIHFCSLWLRTRFGIFIFVQKYNNYQMQN